ncbi:MAG: hypothetical protein ACRDHN_13070 [Thermomicrobiales bacterium]
MVDQLKGLFGGGSNDDDKDDEKVVKLKDFASRYKDGDPNDGYDEDESNLQLQHVLKKASPEQLQAAVKKTYDNLPEGQRAELAQMIEARKKGEGLVNIQRTGDGAVTTNAAASSSDGNPLGDLFGGLLGGGGGGGDLGGLLGGLLGGGSGGSSGGGGGGLGGLLGGLLGGGSKSKATSTDNNATASGGGGLDDLLGSILSGPQGKAILGGIAAFAADAMSNDDKK